MRYTPLQIPVSKEYDAMGIAYINNKYNGKEIGSRNGLLYQLINSENKYSSLIGTFLPVAGVPNVFTKCSDLTSELGDIAVSSVWNPNDIEIRRTDSGLELRASADYGTSYQSLNREDYIYCIFGLTLNITLDT